MQQGLFDLNDMLSLMKQMNRLGTLKKILMMLPNMPKMDDDQVDAAQAMLKKTEVIINSMTRQERKKPEIIKTSRKIRIAKGAGVQPNDVTKLVESFDTMKKQMANMQRNPMAARMMMSQFKKR
jgi:signal recognition particle subunit SRP54